VSKIDDAIKLLQNMQEASEQPQEAAPAVEEQPAEVQTPVVEAPAPTPEQAPVVEPVAIEPAPQEQGQPAQQGTESQEPPQESVEATPEQKVEEILKDISDDTSLDEDLEEINKFIGTQEEKQKTSQIDLLAKYEETLKTVAEKDGEIFAKDARIKFLEELATKKSSEAFESQDKVTALELELKKYQNNQLPEPVAPLGKAYLLYEQAK